jgi:hypothetical protein
MQLGKVSGPVLSLTRSYGASVQRAPLLLQWRGDGSRDVRSMSVPLGTAVKNGLSED